MHILIKSVRLLLMSAFAFMMLLGCSTESKVYIDLGDKENGSDDSTGTPGKASSLVTFSASVEGRDLTRAMSPMNKGLQSWLCAYPSNGSNSITGDPIAEGKYVTSSPGVLAGIQGYKMYLSNNIYSFYAVSSNSSKPAPTFTNGVSDLLDNGVDYLWWSAVQQDVTGSQVNIPIVYQHAATQLVIMIEGGQNLTVNKVVSAIVTPPQPGSTMKLATGVITPETLYGKSASMGINELTVQYIMLPIRNLAPMPLTLQLLVNGENAARTYDTSIPLPNGEFSGGKSYLFRAVIDENTVSFPNVYVKEWTEVDESGNPLYPVQK